MDLFLDETVFDRPRLFLELGNLGLELLVLILQMAQAGLQSDLSTVRRSVRFVAPRNPLQSEKSSPAMKLAPWSLAAAPCGRLGPAAGKLGDRSKPVLDKSFRI